jgi:MinD-like ATPase involved in chromosome partitioning or flagellar assembly
MTDQAQGSVITFYSYKGGTGRTMALANIACILAQKQLSIEGKGVLMIDWDLEAPGLHRFFEDKEQATSLAGDHREDAPSLKPGLIDLFYDLDTLLSAYDKNRAALRGDSATPSIATEKVARQIVYDVGVRKYISPTPVRGLSLLRAGRFNPENLNEYPERVSRFNWEAFYERSPHLIRVFAESLAKQFAYVLIDSRTGVTDISGICTMLLPEKLVIVFTPNVQSLRGGIELMRRATDYRRESADLRPLIVFPLVSRVEANEPELRHDWRFGDLKRGIVGYQPEIESVLSQIYGKKELDLASYFDEIQVQHIPRYAYGEVIAVLIEKTVDRFSLRRSYQAFADKLMSDRLPWEDKSVAQAESVKPTPWSQLSFNWLKLATAGLSKYTLTRSAIMVGMLLVLTLSFLQFNQFSILRRDIQGQFQTTKYVSSSQIMQNLRANARVKWLIRLIPYNEVTREYLNVNTLRELGRETQQYVFVADYTELQGRTVADAVVMVGGSMDQVTGVSAIIFPLNSQIYPANARGVLQVIQDVDTQCVANPAKCPVQKGNYRPFLAEQKLSKDEADDLAEKEFRESWSWDRYKRFYGHYCQLAQNFRCSQGGGQFSASPLIAFLAREWHPLGFSKTSSEDPCQDRFNPCSIRSWDEAMALTPKLGARAFLIRNNSLKNIVGLRFIDFRHPYEDVIPDIGVYVEEIR